MSNELDTTAVSKPRRGRPPKYTPEERQEKYKISVTKWREEHKEECRVHRRQFYNEHSDQVSQMNSEYQTRARNALRLLSEMIDHNEWGNNNPFKELAVDLIKKKKIIYA